MSTATKTLDIPNDAVLISLVYHAVKNNWPFGAHHSKDKDGGWTLAVPADRYGEFLRLRETVKDL